MPVKTLRDYLDSHRVRYLVVGHSPAYTAQEIAALAHVSGSEMAKTVMVSIEGRMAMVVLPASKYLDFELLRELCGTRDVKLAEEKEFAGLFPECEIGAMPPFGNLYGMAVYADEALERDEEIFFNAGMHTELLRIGWGDYKRLVNPVVSKLSIEA